MPRNASGTYSLPNPPYVAGTTIVAATMNSNLSDIGTALTQSVATTGVSSMTGPIKLSAGTLGAPSLTLASDTATGFYNNASGALQFVSSAGSNAVTLSGTGVTISGTLGVTGAVSLTGAISAGQGTFTSTTLPLILLNSTNDASEHTFTNWGLGSGAGNVYNVTGTGTGANDVTTVKHYIGVTEILRFTATTFTFAGNVVVGATKSLTFGTTISINGAGYFDITEIAAPAAPAANVARLYSKDFGGVTELYYQDSAGVENVISPPGAVVGRGFGEYTGNTSFSGTIPQDDTIPQSGEGDQIVTATITLQKATNRIRARFTGWASCNISVPTLTAAIFSSLSANAINVISISADNDDPAINRYNVCLEVEHAPGNVGPLTYQVRAGCSSNYTFNGSSGSRLFGGASRATLILEEIQV